MPKFKFVTQQPLSVSVFHTSTSPLKINFFFFPLQRYEAMHDLIHLLGSLADVKGRIQVPGIYDSVAELTPEEDSLYANIEFDMASALFWRSLPIKRNIVRVEQKGEGMRREKEGGFQLDGKRGMWPDGYTALSFLSTAL